MIGRPETRRDMQHNRPGKRPSGGPPDWLRQMLNRQPWARQPWARWAGTVVLMLVAALAARLGPLDQSGGGPAGPAEGLARLVDGDSLFVGGKEVRLKGIDAPEGRQSCTRDGKSWPCGEEARKQLQRLIAGHTVSCRSVEKDQHDRLLGYCFADGKELNREMVRAGYALAYGSFEAEERDAKSQRRGLWSGEFEKPRDWRRSHGIGGR